jgi:hypothetical protein
MFESTWNQESYLYIVKLGHGERQVNLKRYALVTDRDNLIHYPSCLSDVPAASIADITILYSHLKIQNARISGINFLLKSLCSRERKKVFAFAPRWIFSSFFAITLIRVLDTFLTLAFRQVQQSFNAKLYRPVRKERCSRRQKIITPDSYSSC